MSWRHGLAAAVLLLAGGCESIGYYRQVIEGHLGVMASARPIDAWLADPSTSPALRERSRRVSKPCVEDRKSTRLNSSHMSISYAVFCLKKKKKKTIKTCILDIAKRINKI